MTWHGCTTRFHEADRAGDHRTFQWAEATLPGGLAVVLVVITVLLLRRRA